MTSDTYFVSPRDYSIKLNLILCLVIIDCGLSASMNNIWNNYSLVLGFYISQIVLNLLFILLFFSILQKSFILQFALVSIFLREFNFLLLVWLFRFMVLIGAGIPRILSATVSGYWENWGFHFLYILSNFNSILFYSLLIINSIKIGKCKYYNSNFWNFN